MTERANTMKTYILRDSKTVEPQNRNHKRTPNPPPAPPPPASGPAWFLGLDVHNDSIAVSIAPSDATEVRRYGIIGGEHDDVMPINWRSRNANASGRCWTGAPPRW
jgi:hypothetical protein